MTAWLTPIWFVSVGIAGGLVILAALVLLFKALSNVPPWEALSHSATGHVAAAILTAALAGGLYFLIPKEFWGAENLQEPVLLLAVLFLLCGIIGWSAIFCCSKQAARNAFVTLGEGAAGYLMICAIVIVLVGCGVWGVGAAMGPGIVAEPVKAFASLPKIFATGRDSITVTIPAAAAGDNTFHPVEVPIDFSLLSSLSVNSDRSVILADAAKAVDFRRTPRRVAADETLSWDRKQELDALPIPYEEGTQLHIQNREVTEATIRIDYLTIPPVPQATTFVITAFCVVLVGLSLLLQQAVAPRASAVAFATIKNELAQPLFLVLMSLGVIGILLYEFLSFNTFGEDIKLLKDCGITTIMLLAAFQGIWSASSSISEEIEGKTALTVLSKPIMRRSFVIGKFLGIFWVLFLMFTVLGALEIGAVCYKPIYEARETSTELPVWQVCHTEMVSTVPGLIMAFMQSVVLMAISVALASRLPQLANLAVCFSIYVIGNLTTSLVSSTQEGFEIVKFVASLVATIIPILEHFSLQAAIDADNQITMSLLAGSLIYCLLYVLLSMFLALLLFEDRDLA